MNHVKFIARPQRLTLWNTRVPWRRPGNPLDSEQVPCAVGKQDTCGRVHRPPTKQPNPTRSCSTRQLGPLSFPPTAASEGQSVTTEPGDRGVVPSRRTTGKNKLDLLMFTRAFQRFPVPLMGNDGGSQTGVIIKRGGEISFPFSSGDNLQPPYPVVAVPACFGGLPLEISVPPLLLRYHE